MNKDFNDFRFSGLNWKPYSNKYITMNRVSEDKTKIVVRVANTHIKPTPYGFALILDETHVVFLKSWAVNENFYGVEVLLDKKYWTVKEWGNHPEFIGCDACEHEFSTWVSAAEEQSMAGNIFRWDITNKTQKNRAMYGY